MNFHADVLSYLSEKSGVPIWVLDAGGRMVYSSFPAEKLNDPDRVAELLGHFRAGDDSSPPRIQRLDENELFGGLGFGTREEPLALIVGPAYQTHPYGKSVKTANSFNFLLRREEVKAALLQCPAVRSSEFCRLVAVLAAVLTGRDYDVRELAGGITDRTLAHVLNRQLVELIFDMREEERATVYAPDEERKLLALVAKGDVEAVRNFRMPTVRAPSAEDTRQQTLFEAVALITLATRAAIGGGLDYIVAYSLSDLYFKRLSQSSTEKEITEITGQVLVHFAQKVRELGGQDDRAYSPYVTRCIRYIRAHLHYPISLDDVARELSINPKYLSRLFIASQGEKFSSFVQRERVNEAKSLLDDTDCSIIEISHSLGFSSQSYFIKVFTRFVGMTPGQYAQRKKRGRGPAME